MGIAQIPASSGGLASVVKSIQRGVAASAGNITITAVDIAKTIVNSFSTASTGTVAASGAISAATGSTSSTSAAAASGNLVRSYWYAYGSQPVYTHPPTATYTDYNERYGVTSYPAVATHNQTVNVGAHNINAANITLNAQNLSGGTTNLIAGVNGAYLSDSTTLVVTGPCRYEVVEYF